MLSGLQHRLGPASLNEVLHEPARKMLAWILDTIKAT